MLTFINPYHLTQLMEFMTNTKRSSSELHFYRPISILYKALITFFIFCALLAVCVLTIYDV